MTDHSALIERLEAGFLSSNPHHSEVYQTNTLLALAAAALRDLTEWRNIATAPKDGTEIIIYRDGWVSAPRAKWGDHDGEDDDGREITFGGWFLASEWDCPGVEDGFVGWNEDIEGGCMPTVWLPLPSAPNQAKEAGE